MNRYRKWLVAIIMCISLAYSGSASALGEVDNANMECNTEETQGAPFVEGEVLVMYEEVSSPRARSVAGQRFSADMQVEETYSFAVENPNKLRSRAAGTGVTNLCVALVKSNRYTTEELIEIFKEDSSIRYVEPNFKMHVLTADYTDFQWALKNNGNNAGIEDFDMHPEAVVEMDSGDIQEKVIAIVDTGVDYTHSDLADRMWKNPFEEAQLKGVCGYNFADVKNTDPMDDNGHGTHCAGVAAGNDDGNGISGIAASNHVKIMAIKVMDSSGTCDSMATVGAYSYIYRAQQLGVNVVAINNSWGISMSMDEYWKTKEAVIPQEGILKELMNLVGENGAVSCCASGNENRDTDEYFSYPANIDSPYVISVAACDEQGNKTSFSNYGKVNVDVAAPGANILSSVNYNSFYPTIYSDAKREEVCHYMNSLEGEEEQVIVQTVERLKDVPELAVEVTDDTYYGSGNAGHSLAFSVEEGKDGTWYIPYEMPQGQGDYYMSADVKMKEDNPNGHSYVYMDTVYVGADQSLESVKAGRKVSGEAGNYWKHLQWKVNDKNEEGGKRYLVIRTSLTDSTSATVYLDNWGISKRVEDTDAFEKYDLKSGTSMATPYVTGAVAAIAQVYPNASAKERKDMLLTSCRKMAGLKGVCATEGMVDLALLKTPNVIVEKTELDENNNIIIRGSFLKDVQVSCNGETAKVLSTEDKAITLDGQPFENQNVRIEITKGENVIERSIFVPKAKRMEQCESTQGACSATRIVTDGEKVYGISNYGEVHIRRKTDDGEVWEKIAPVVSNNMFDVSFSQSVKSNVLLEGDPVVCDGTIYCILRMETSTKVDMMVASIRDGEKWEPVQKLPAECMEHRGMTLAAYDGTIYLLGGYDEEQNALVSHVYQLNGENGSWSPIQDMPEARGFAKALQVGTQLIVTMGACDENGSFPKNMIYDGKQWRVSEAELQSEMTTKSFEGKKTDGQEIFRLEYYAPNVALVEDGIVYQGMNVVGLGNIIGYSVTKDCFGEMPFSDEEETLQEQQGIVVVGDELQIYHIMPLQNTTNKYISKIQNGYVTADVVGLDMAEITGCKTWLPCDSIAIKLVAKNGTYFDRVTANDEKISMDHNEYLIEGKASDYVDSGLRIEGKMYAYIQKLQLVNRQELLPGKTVKLSVSTEPANQVKEEYKWESDNQAVATVDSSGMVKVADAAKPGDTAKITVTAMDQGTVTASCEIVVAGATTSTSGETENPVKKQPVPAKGSKKTIGKLIYKVTKSDGVNGTVTCVKMSKTGYTSVIIPETVAWNGYTFKVTAISANAFKSSKKLKSVSIGKNVNSIGKNAFRSCKVLKKVTIKSAKINKIGKNAFYSVHKKCSIKIPKKKKKLYNKILKKSGYKYQIKCEK